VAKATSNLLEVSRLCSNFMDVLGGYADATGRRSVERPEDDVKQSPDVFIAPHQSWRWNEERFSWESD
jgi:hypothetical protein